MDKCISNPKVSVIMSAYNEEEIIINAIESILNQIFKDFELIIVDDGSSDKTPEILENYTKKDKRIKIITNLKNIGLTKSLNKAIKIAGGRYIARMDADVISSESRLKKQVNFLERKPELTLAGSFANIIDEGTGGVLRFKPHLNHNLIKKSMFFSNQFCHVSVMFRKDIIQKLGGYNEDFILAQDYQLWFKMVREGRVANIPEFLVSYKRREKGLGVTRRKTQIYFANKARKEAIQERLYPLYYILFFPWLYFKALFPTLIPPEITKILRKLILYRD